MLLEKYIKGPKHFEKFVLHRVGFKILGKKVWTFKGRLRLWSSNKGWKTCWWKRSNPSAVHGHLHVIGMVPKSCSNCFLSKRHLGLRYVKEFLEIQVIFDLQSDLALEKWIYFQNTYVHPKTVNYARTWMFFFLACVEKKDLKKQKNLCVYEEISNECCISIWSSRKYISKHF